MQKDYISILKDILKEYAAIQSISPDWFEDLVNIKLVLNFYDVLDAMDELLEEIENNPEIHYLIESVRGLKKLLIDRQDKQVIFDLLIG